MNLKLRFALLFTFFVAVILLISSCTIYFLYYTYRESEFFERVKSEALAFHNTIPDSLKPGQITSQLFTHLLHNSTVYDERVVVMDAKGKIIRHIPDTLQFVVTDEILKKKKSGETYLWYDTSNYQYAGMVLKNTDEILVGGGYDRPGFQKLYNLKLILAAVFAGALLFTAFMSFLFVREAFMPLKRLSVQMQQTTSLNLAQRLEVKKEKDEIADIAMSFNGMLERLDGAFDFQKSFVYHASHELRTPLATMLSETEAALNREMSIAECKKVLASLKEEQQELIELTNSLLLISQSDEMGYTRDWPGLRVDEVLHETAGYSKRMLPDLVVTILYASLPDNPDDFLVRGNESLLRSVFANLIKNAYMYSINQKVNITLESAGDIILIHFDNTGTQLPADEKDRILTPFFRGSNALKTKGYGLGLAIVSRFIAIHKGTVTYTPIFNDINRFTITLTNIRAAGA